MRLSDNDIEILHQLVCAEHEDRGPFCWLANTLYWIHVRLLVGLLRVGRIL